MRQYRRQYRRTARAGPGVEAKLRTAEADETTKEREKAAAASETGKIPSADPDEDDSDSEPLDCAVTGCTSDSEQAPCRHQ